MDEKTISKCQDWAREIRRDVIEVAHSVGKMGTHIGSALSAVEILSCLYGSILHFDSANPEKEDRDIFVLSKGHAYMVFYAALAKAGFFSKQFLSDNFMKDGGALPVHPVKNLQLGIEFSSGSLGTGMPFCVGKALALKQNGLSSKLYALVGDGECNEGSVWEAFVSASSLKLSNLTVIIDRNGLQQDGATSDVLNMDVSAMAKACGWNVVEVDGHSVEELLNAFAQCFDNEKPKCIVANTIKGKGISFMENDNTWHHSFMSEKQYQQAVGELG